MQTCEYKPMDVYERPANRDVSPPEIEALVLDINYDTLFLYTEKPINFRFVSSNQEIKTVRFLIDNVQRFTVDSDNGTFLTSLVPLDDGIHSLVIEVYTATGTNSIAELMGAEMFLFSKSWKIFVDRNYYSRTKASLSNGFLKLSWPKYRDYDFKEYVVSRMVSYNTEVVLGKLKSTEFIDSSYVGEGGIYSVRVDNRKAKLMDWGEVQLSRELPSIKLMPAENEPYILSWSRIKYFNAVDSVRISRSVVPPYNYVTVKTTADPNDTSYVLQTGNFADRVDYKLLLKPKRRNIRFTQGSYELFESRIYPILGFPFTSNTSIFQVCQVSQDEFVYRDGCDSIIRYSVSNKHPREQLGYRSPGCSKCEFSDLTFSVSGKYVTNYANCSFDVMLVPSNNMHNYIIRDLKPYSGQNNWPDIPVSDVGTAIVNKGSGGFVIYDFTTNTSLAAYPAKSLFVGEGLSISPDGKYILLSDDSLRLVRFTDSHFTNIWKQTSYPLPKYVGFDGANSEQIVLWNGVTFFVRLCNDFSEVYSFPLSDDAILDIDFYNKEILTSKPGHLYVRNYLDGSLIKDLPVTNTSGFYLVNHAIISSKGVIYFIK